MPESIRRFYLSLKMYHEGKKTRERSFYASLFKRQLRNGESIYREWLLYSPSQGSVYCFVCRLFSSSESKFALGSGYSDWKHAVTRIAEHENNANMPSMCLPTVHARRQLDYQTVLLLFSWKQNRITSVMYSNELSLQYNFCVLDDCHFEVNMKSLDQQKQDLPWYSRIDQ